MRLINRSDNYLIFDNGLKLEAVSDHKYEIQRDGLRTFVAQENLKIGDYIIGWSQVKDTKTLNG